MKLDEKTISEKYIYKGNNINFKIQEVELPNGKTGVRETVEHPGAVAIIPFIDEDRVILIEQFRKAIDKIIIEIPAGKFKGKEEPETCGRRELEEETGYKAENFQYLGKIFMSPGYSNQVVYLYKATGLYKGQVNWDDDEFINLNSFTLKEVKDMVIKGKIVDAKTIVALTYL